MKNYIQPGKNLTFKAPCDIRSGEDIKIGKIVGVAIADAKKDNPVTLATEGVYEFSEELNSWQDGSLVYRLGNGKLSLAVPKEDSKAYILGYAVKSENGKTQIKLAGKS